MTTAALALADAPTATSTHLELLDDRARDYAYRSRAEATWRGYASDWRGFAAWCRQHGLQALPAAPETVARYLVDAAARYKTGSLQRHLSAIASAHRAGGHESPTRAEAVRLVWAGIRREHGTAQQGKAPLVTADVAAMVAALPRGPLGVRDRALLLVGFAGAFRRSELVALDVADVERTAAGLVVTIRRSKTDQEGAGRKLGIPAGKNPRTCPVRALRAWLELARIQDGPLFRGVDRHGNVLGRLSDRGVARAVKRAAERAGLDPERYAGHSLRAGLATAAAAAGVEERVIARQTGHRSMVVLRRYIRDGELFRPGQNAAAAVGL